MAVGWLAPSVDASPMDPLPPCEGAGVAMANSNTVHKPKSSAQISLPYHAGNFSLVNSTTECSGAENDKGYVSTLACCAQTCRGQSSWFIYGRTGERCDDSGCRCYCEVPGKALVSKRGTRATISSNVCFALSIYLCTWLPDTACRLFAVTVRRKEAVEP